MLKVVLLKKCSFELILFTIETMHEVRKNKVIAMPVTVIAMVIRL